MPSLPETGNVPGASCVPTVSLMFQLFPADKAFPSPKLDGNMMLFPAVRVRAAIGSTLLARFHNVLIVIVPPADKSIFEKLARSVTLKLGFAADAVVALVEKVMLLGFTSRKSPGVEENCDA